MSHSDIPKGWTVASIDDVATSSGGSTPSKSDPSFWTNGNIPWVSPKDMKTFDLRSSEDLVSERALARLTEIPENSVLLVVRSGILSRTLPVAVNIIPVTINQDMRAFIPEKNIEPRFIAWQLIANERNILDNCSKDGTTVASIEGPALSAFPLSIAPAAEQTRIVEKLEKLLSDLDAGVTELKAAQAKLMRYRQSLLKAAVEGALTAEWRKHTTPEETGVQLLQRILTERRDRWETKQLAKFAEQGKAPPKDWQKKYPEPVQPDTNDLPELPEGWVWATIDQLSIAQKYGSSAKTSQENHGVPVLRMGNIQDGEIDVGNLKYLPTNHSEFPELLLNDGDLLFNRTNSPELVGKTAIYRSQISPCSYASYLIAVTFSRWCIPELIAAFINSAYGRHWVNSVVTQQTGQANVNGTKLSALAIPLAPLEEQHSIFQILSSQQKIATQHADMIMHGSKQSTAQRKNILRAAFSGQLVPQDPNDEPASALLARIRAGRAERGKAQKARKPKKRMEITAVANKLIDVLTEAGDWMPAQEAFRRCGIADGALTDQIETLYAELRALDKSGRLAVEAVIDAQGRKLHDRLKVLED